MKHSSVLVRSILIILVVSAWLVPAGSVQAQNQRVGWITFDGEMPEKPNPFAWLVGSQDQAGFCEMLSRFDDAAERDDIEALAIHIKDLQVNFSQIQALSRAITRVQQAGKKVHIFAEAYGPGELMLAAGADEIIIQDGGYISFPGLYTEEMYLADALAWLGLKADMVQVGDYKGASEQYARNTPSKEWSENIDGLLDDLWAQMCDRIRTGRGMNKVKFNRVLNEAFFANSKDAIALGLIDSAVDVLDLRDHILTQHEAEKITGRLGDDGDTAAMNLSNPFLLLAKLQEGPKHDPTRDTIAIVHIDGPIVDGKSSAGGMFGGESVGSRTIRKALKTIEEDDLIKGLVIRINSPGGSAVASEMIWRGVRRVAGKKPVFISVGSMAASGGYYIAVSGDRIYVDEASIVGSIGVVGGKIAMGGLYDKINVNVTSRSRGPRAGLQGSVRLWTEDERAIIHELMTETYDLFCQRVTQGRGRKANLNKIAAGRLFTGKQAIKNGMADGIADFEGTITQLASSVGLGDGSYDVMTYPGPMSLEEMMEQMLPFMSAQAGANMEGANSPVVQLGAAALAQIIGPRHWPQLRDALNGLMQLRDEPVLLLNPRVILMK